MPKNDDHRNPFNSRLFYRIAALALAILLFIYVNGEKLSSTHQTERNSETASLTSTKKKTLTMPLDLTVDSNRYIVSGYPKTIRVTVSGPAALVTATANTQNFKVYADLSNLGPGKHTVTPKQTGMNKDLTYHFNPQKITVQIQTRKTVTMPVKVKANTTQLADGYKAGKATSSTDDVQITGAIAEVNKVDHVVASINLTKDDKKDVSKSVTLQAVDKNGNTVNVVVTPQTATVSVPITKQQTNSSSSTSDHENQSSSKDSESTESSQSSESNDSSSSVTSTSDDT